MRNSILYGPVIFSVVGAACGVVSAMTWRYDAQYDRVDLESSVPLAVGGAVCGIAVGCFVMLFHFRRPRWRPSIEVGALALLFAGVGAIHGWVLGAKAISNPPP